MFSIEVLPNGHLKVMAGNEARRWIKEEQSMDRDSDTILADGTEGYWTNGSFQPFDAGAANPAVGLTCAPCIAEAMDVLDDGRREVQGRLWWYPQYERFDPVEELKRKGQVIFTLAH
ncbi:hypothetical protein [Ottowia sp.]|uniref:hypothetical protein n=1 Tax=Ottowia sp. TaxID=1898956 RepID=UPI0025F0C83F|nr:hypothetical protein [Ottowia sp.]MBK6616534.1 hypothetical protein [Ottowia sp.]